MNDEAFHEQHRARTQSSNPPGASVSALSTLVPGPGVDDGFQSIEGELHVSYFWYPHW